ncbi:hypothetical protein HMPREF1544_07322 [Mucor circinelloides 1006PhL]|uniref:BZIP domain-containing protein n=1 Tax=Mucor circinelloides f. circinelloides (strain 1006PhL) TaxID=1220926 RepID=S2J722_MUCC1|nr:hypothetical protein HMPREF1544_07322 [Mucor circinelloides 1006PhL]KAG1107262.1 hypothetical protein G6F42_016432 [Rhizopus arrhizus]
MTNETSVQSAPKVGRHRVYSNEQRKDRNRQAQAAFRDRRSKYTQSLENAIINFEETIKNLKETNNQSIKRAQMAEERSHHLASEVVSLQKLLEMALADNQRLQAQVALGNDMLPLSPNSDNLTNDAMPSTDPILQLFDINPTMPSPMSSATSDDQFDLFNTSILTGESPRSEAVL